MFKPLLTKSSLADLNFEQYSEVTQTLAEINRQSIDDELAHLPAIFSYYYGLMVVSKKSLDNANIDVEHFSAHLSKQVRVGKDKLPAHAIASEVNSDLDLKSLHNNVARCEEIYGFMRGICQTLDHKKDMLVQLSANKRQETKLYQ